MRSLHTTTRELPPLATTREKSAHQQRPSTTQNNKKVNKKWFLFNFLKIFNVFIWLCWVLAAAGMIFDFHCGMQDL